MPSDRAVPTGPRRVLGALLADPAALAAVLTDRLSSELTAYRGAPQDWTRELVDDCRAQLAAVLEQLDHPGDFDTSLARRIGHDRAGSGFPLSAVMDAYRVGTRFLWQALVDARGSRQVTSEELVSVADRLWAAQDQFTQAMAEGYREAATSRILTREAERAAIVEALLQGQVLSQELLWDVASALQLPQRGPFVVVVAEVAEVGRLALPEVETRLRAADLRSAWRLRPDTHVGIVCTPSPRLTARLGTVLAGYASVRQGISPAYDDLDQTGRALRLARIAMTGAPHTGGVVVFDDEPLRVAAVADPDVMRRVADTVLGPLRSMRPEDRAILLDTLDAWLAGQGSADRAAERLFCHPNTVRQRLRRLEERTGRSLADPRDVTQLCLALEADRLLVFRAGSS